MARLLFLGLALILTSPALAQQTPPPPRTVTGAPTASGQIGQILFDAAEKAVIEKFFGRMATAAPSEPTTTTGETIKRVIDAATGATTTARKDDDGADDEQRGSKDKKDKHWKKDKNKGKGKGRGKNKGMPPGLAKRKSLPPGLQKQLERNGRLPPGLQKRELPDELWAQLPPPKQGTERVVAGNDVVLIHEATGIVLDILRDVVTPK